MTGRGFYQTFDLDVGAVQTSLTALAISQDDLDDLIARGATSAVDVLKLNDVPKDVTAAARHMVERMADHAAEQKRQFEARAEAYAAGRLARALTAGRLIELLQALPASTRIFNTDSEDYVFEDDVRHEDERFYL